MIEQGMAQADGIAMRAARGNFCKACHTRQRECNSPRIVRPIGPVRPSAHPPLG